jgi:hypothetical protein
LEKILVFWKEMARLKLFLEIVYQKVEIFLGLLLFF